MRAKEFMKEGDVIRTKFQQALAHKKGMSYNPDVEPPVSQVTGKSFVRFETQLLPSGTSAHIIGVLDDGTAEIVGTTRKDMAATLAKAYNAGGFTDQDIEMIPMGDYFT